MDTEFANTKYYQLQLKPSCQLNCSYCPGLGLLSTQNKVHHDLDQSLKKARSGNYSAALIPCNALEMDDLQIFVETIHSYSLQPIVQINSRQLHNQKARIEDILKWKGEIQIIWGNNNSVPDSILSLIKENLQSFHITIVAHKRMHALETFRSLPDVVKNRAFFYFPLHQNPSDEYFTVESIYEFLKRFKIQFPGYKALPTPGIDIFDQQKKPWQDFEPSAQPIYSSPACDAPEALRTYSVIVPTYNCEKEITKTLAALSQQTMDRNLYEVIVIDEGSTDNTVLSVIDFAKSAPLEFQVKVVRLPSFSIPSNDKPDHRTAVSLNLGVKLSKGEHLFFLDAKTLVPRNTLSRLVGQHSEWDLVQTRRLMLPSDISEIDLKVLEPTELKSIAIPENPFWEQFYSNGENWNHMTDGWRYISSKNLSMRRDVFEFIGWYRKTWMYYGFEDSDLGYRARKKGFNFHLSELPVYQVSPSKEVTSILKKSFEKQDSLSKMAKAFFQNNLDTDIYENLRSYM